MRPVIVIVFIVSAILHLTFIILKNQCYRNKNQSWFIHSSLEAGWPYVLSSVCIKYILPVVLNFFGFGPLGILPRSIAAWIQSIYGTSSLFSLLQSIGARGGVQNPLASAIMSGSLFKWFFNRGSNRDLVYECVNFYELCSFYLSIFDLLFLVGYFLYRRRRVV